MEINCWKQLNSHDHEAETSDGTLAESVVEEAVTVKAATAVTRRVVKKSDAFKVVCYFSSWAWRRSDDYAFVPENVVPSTCTHLVYAYAGLDAEDLVIKSIDTWTDTQFAGRSIISFNSFIFLRKCAYLMVIIIINNNSFI